MSKFNFLTLGQKGVVVILDQGLYSLVNFAANIVLARSVGQEAYGAFSIVFAVYLILYRPYSAIILEPMSVLLPKKEGDGFEKHFQGHLAIHLLFTIPISVLLFFIGIIFQLINSHSSLSQPLILMSLIISILFLFLMLRQMLYILQKPIISLFGSLIYFFGMSASLYLINFFDIISSNAVLIAMGIVNLIACLTMFSSLNIKIRINSKYFVLNQFKHNWVYGKWMVLSAVLISIATEGPLLMVSIITGVSSAGIIRAAMNIVRPIQIVVVSICQFILPMLARDIIDGRSHQFQRKHSLLKLFLTILGVFNAIAIYIFRDQIEFFFYGGKYSKYVDLFVLWGFVMIFMSLYNGYTLLLKAENKPKAVSKANLVWAIVSVGLGLVLIPQFNVWGVTLAAFVGYISVVLVLLYLISSNSRSRIGER